MRVGQGATHHQRSLVTFFGTAFFILAGEGDFTEAVSPEGPAMLRKQRSSANGPEVNSKEQYVQAIGLKQSPCEPRLLRRQRGVALPLKGRATAALI